MTKAIAYSVVPMLLALPSAQASSAAGAKTRVRHTVVAASGSAAPAGGNYIRFFVARLNPRSHVAFDALLGGPSGPSGLGVFVGDGRRTSTIALSSLDPAAENFGFVNNPFITPQGRVVFDVNQTDTFRSGGETVIPLVRNGDPAPGGGTLSPRANQHVANARGAIAYLADVLGATATEGIFRADGVDTVAIARDDDIPPTGGTFDFFSQPALNNRGQVAFLAAMTGGRQISGSSGAMAGTSRSCSSPIRSPPGARRSWISAIR